jgi:Ca2+-binding RTX toxin-like protein
MSSLAVALALTGAAAPAAHAAPTVTYAFGGANAGMTVTDSPGLASNIVITGSADMIGARTAGPPITAGAGCMQVSTHEVSCFASGPRIATVNLGDGDDRLGYNFNAVAGSFVRGGDGNDDIQGGTGSDSIDGEGGDDSVQGGGAEDAVSGGPGNDVIGNFTDAGNDTMNGGDGNDRIVAFRDTGADVYSGGAGTDLMDYIARDEPVSVSLDDVANDGAAGEGDNARSDLENIRGGNAGDVLVGDSGRNLLEGVGGDDTLRGGTPPSKAGIFGVKVDDTLDGGVGRDVLKGEGGADVLLARDAEDDQALGAMSCGSGADRLDADLADDNTREIPADCETVDQGAIDEGRNVRIAGRTLRGGRSGSVRVRLTCPRSVRIGCRGALGAGTAGGTRYRIRRGRSTRVRVRVPGSVRRALSRRRRVPVRLVSIERGSHGPKTTIRTVTLRR